jgi:hypothetical protein
VFEGSQLSQLNVHSKLWSLLRHFILNLRMLSNQRSAHKRRYIPSVFLAYPFCFFSIPLVMYLPLNRNFGISEDHFLDVFLK